MDEETGSSSWPGVARHASEIQQRQDYTSVASPPSIDQTGLHALLDSYRVFSPSYGDNLSNHLPMATTALWRMGADASQLSAFGNSYSRKLRTRSRDGDESSVDSTPALGAGEYEHDSRYFSRRLAENGADVVLEEWIPRLLPGLAAAAYHCLIRTAYAIESGCNGELADALGYWSAEHTAFDLRWEESDQSPRQILDEVVGQFFDKDEYPGIIIDRMVRAAQDPYFSGGVPLPRSATLADIRAAVLGLYYECEDFTLLHTVTATHALRLLLRFAGDETMACQYLWQAHTLAVATVAATVHASRETDAADGQLIDWGTILRKSLDSADDHVVKLVYTAWQEAQFGDNDLYRLIAARKVGLNAQEGEDRQTG